MIEPDWGILNLYENDVRACFCQRESHRFPDAPRAACDQGGFAREGEEGGQ